MPKANLVSGWNSFGFSGEFSQGGIVVTSLFKGLAADKAGLKIGDEIVLVNGQKVDCNNYCDCIGLLARLFDENLKLVLTIKREQGAKEILVSKDQVY